MPHKLDLLATDLAEAIGRAAYKPNDDVHKFIKLETPDDEQRLTITSTDGAIILQQNLLHEGGTLPDIAVEAAKLSAALMQRHDTITLKANDECDTLRVQQGKSRFDIPAIKGELFPDLPAMHRKPIEADTRAFLEGLRRVGHAAGKNLGQQFANGVLVNNHEIFACDSHRAARMPFASGIDEPGIIIPTQALNIISKLVRDDYTINLISHAEDMPPGMIEFGGEDLSLYVRLIDARYPDTDRITPSIDNARYRLAFTPMQVSASLDRLSRFDEVMVLDIGDNKLKLSTRDSQAQDYATVNEAAAPEEIAIMIRYVQDVLHLADKEATINWDAEAADGMHRLQIEGQPETHYIGAIRR